MSDEDKELIAELRALQKRIRNFHGVMFDKQARKYRATITYNGRIEVLGFFYLRSRCLQTLPSRQKTCPN
jgi:hypothetical protein